MSFLMARRPCHFSLNGPKRSKKYSYMSYHETGNYIGYSDDQWRSNIPKGYTVEKIIVAKVAQRYQTITELRDIQQICRMSLKLQSWRVGLLIDSESSKFGNHWSWKDFDVLDYENPTFRLLVITCFGNFVKNCLMNGNRTYNYPTEEYLQKFVGIRTHYHPGNDTCSSENYDDQPG